MAISRICKVEDCAKPRHSHGYCSAHAHRFQRHGDPLGGGSPRGSSAGSPASFYRDVVMTYEGDECLIWPYAKDGRGYGQIGDGGKLRLVSRFACERANGPAPTPDHEAAHSCGRGDHGCVTKRHLSWKTHAENEADKLLHGTSNRGERHGMSKLKAADVIEIRNLRGHLFQREIAERFGIAVPTVSDIHRRKLWAWL